MREIAGQSDNEGQDEPMDTTTVQQNNITKSASKSSQVSLLETRRSMYAKAVEAAKASGDTSKTRRLDRQLKVNIFARKQRLNSFFN